MVRVSPFFVRRFPLGRSGPHTLMVRASKSMSGHSNAQISP